MRPPSERTMIDSAMAGTSVEAWNRRSASAFTSLSDSRRMSRMPSERSAQYRRNRRRERGSVVLTRVSVRNREVVGPRGSASRVQTILAYPGSSKPVNASGSTPRNSTSGRQGCVTAPTAISRSGISARMRQPSARVSARSGVDDRSGGSRRHRDGSVLRAKIARTRVERLTSMSRAAAKVYSAGASTWISWRSATSQVGMKRSMSEPARLSGLELRTPVRP